MSDKRAELRNAMIELLDVMLRQQRMAITHEQMRDIAAANKQRHLAVYHQGMADLCVQTVVDLDKVQALISSIAEAAPIPASTSQHAYAMAEFQAIVQSVFAVRQIAPKNMEGEAQ